MVQTIGLEHLKVSNKRKLPKTLLALDRLSWNYWWSWAADGSAVYRDLDPDTWEECEHNPRQLLVRAAEFRLAQMATDPIYCRRVQDLADRFDRYMAEVAPGLGCPEVISPARPVAYFCAEYGVHNSLPLYSGGLGVLAGDHLKSASDLNLPLIAVGLLYRYGYFRQHLTREGWQEEHYGETHPDELPIKPVSDEKGRVIIEVTMRGRVVRALAWRADVGRVRLFLLDTNIEENEETDRWVTGHLYGGDRETRLVQEMMLGIGGVRLLRRLAIEPSVFHLNEGHSAFLTLELARELIEAHQIKFDEAAAIVRERCVFTTHTPVAAGHDEFEAALIEKCFGDGLEKALGLSHDEFLDLGRVDKNNDAEWYGLTPLALRISRKVNGVSRKHGEVSRALWNRLWPDRETSDVPITYVTNGVHTQTWVAPLIRSLYEKYAGADWPVVARDPDRWRQAIEAIPDEELWEAHNLLKQRLISFVRHRSYHARLQRGESPEYTDAALTLFDVDVLTIGFARRVAGYKRWDLLLTDPERVLKLLGDKERPVQFVFAGKAHPQDQGAKLVLQQMARWKYQPSVMHRAVFLQNYDQEIARQLVQSVDVWLNVPRRPLEASGTSGQKVAINGGLNLSILDGWWIEGYDGTNGWAIGEEKGDVDAAEVDARDAESLFDVLEREVVPAFYKRDQNEIPHQWLRRMKRSIATLVPVFNSDRMVWDYVNSIYCPGS